MAFEAGTIVAQIKADLTNFKEGLQKAQQIAKDSTAKIGSGLDGLKAKFEKNSATVTKYGLAFAAVGATAGLAIKGFIDAANERLRTEKQLEAVLLSTKNAAGLTKEEILGMAGALQATTTIADDTIVAGQNMLLTFTGIGKEVFPQATETMLDMATAMNGGVTPSAESLKGTAIQLGKALNDPIDGIASLSRVGVKFTDTQKDMIEKMVKLGDVAGAQKLILKELATEFGGSARAQAATYEGQMIQLKNSFGDLQEELGLALLPALQRFGEWLQSAVSWFTALDPGVKDFIAKGLLIVAVVGTVGGTLAILSATIIPAVITGIQLIGSALMFLAANPVGLIIVAIAALFLAFKTNFMGFQDFVMNLWEAIKVGMGKISDAFTATGKFISDLVQSAVNTFRGIVQGFKDVWEAIKGAFSAATEFILDLVVGIFAMMGINIIAVWEGIKATISSAWEAIKLAFNTALTIIKTAWNTVWGAIKGFMISVWEGIKGAVTDSLLWIKGKIDEIAGPIGKAWGAMWTGLTGIVTTAWEAVKDTIKASLNWIIDKINSVISAINGIAAKGAALIGKEGPKMSTIPRLAQGGIVSRPTLAMIGEGGESEAIVPLSKMGEFARNAGMGGPGGVTVVIQGDVMDEDSAVELLERAFRRIRPNLGI